MATDNLLSKEDVADPKPRYQCFVEGCPAEHESKWQVCPEAFRGEGICSRCGRQMRRQLMGMYVCDFCMRYGYQKIV